MRRRATVSMAALALVALAVFAASGIAGIKQQYRHAYNVVAKDLGKRAPGRDILKYGVRVEGGSVRPARKRDLEKSYKVLFRMQHPAPVAAPTRVSTTTSANASATPRTSAPAPSSGGDAIPSYIVQCESGGNYNAVNSSSGAYGKYQIMPSTASAYGCDLSSPGGQDECARRIYADRGPSAWSCG